MNRAPTLHRLGIQAFEPVLIEGKAIQIHPLVCTAFNADFDGDQMAVHLPLSAEAQAEARVLMLSANNILSPATGRPITVPTQDMVFGAYYLTLDGRRAQGRGSDLPPPLRGRGGLRGGRHRAARARSRSAAARTAIPFAVYGIRHGEDARRGAATRFETTPGRMFFNTALPADFGFVNDVVGTRGDLDRLDRRAARGELPEGRRRREPRRASRTSASSSRPVRGSRSRSTTCKTPPDKRAILDRYEKEAEKAEAQFKRGIITDDERRQKEIEIWTSANSEVGRAMEKTLATIAFNPLDMMVDSGARGNPQQVRQIAGMKGLVSNPRGEMIPRPIISSFREGLSVLEYFISTHGARKGLADTALRTADSGYLTRRLVDVAQELIIREEDCGIDARHLDRRRRARRGRASAATSRPAPTAGCSSSRSTLADGTHDRGRHVLSDADMARLAADPDDRPHPGPLGAHLRGRARRLRRLLRPVARDRPG